MRPVPSLTRTEHHCTSPFSGILSDGIQVSPEQFYLPGNTKRGGSRLVRHRRSIQQIDTEPTLQLGNLTAKLALLVRIAA